MSITSTKTQKTRGTSELTDNGYQRPSDWVSVPALPSDNTEIAYFVVAVDDIQTDGNRVNIDCFPEIPGDTFEIDWGDGTVETGLDVLAGGHEHTYNYSTLSGSATSEGYKTVLITVTATSGNTGNIVTLDISKGGSGEYFAASSFLEMYVNMPYITRLYQATTHIKHRRMRYIEVSKWNLFEVHIASYMSSLEYVKLPWQPTSNSITTVEQAFAFCYSLREAPYFDTSSVTDASEMFLGCRRLKSVPTYDFSSLTDGELMFAGCESLEELPQIKLGSLTNMQQFAEDTTSLKRLPNLDTSTVTNMSQAFKNSGLIQFPNLDVSSVTNFNSTWFGTKIRELPELNFPTAQADYASAFSNAKVLEKLPDSLANINPTNVYGMFEHAHNVRHVPSFSLTNAATCGRMFYNTYNLIILNDFDFTGKTSAQMQNAFVSMTSTKRILATGFEDDVIFDGALSGDALDELYTNLPTVTGKDITIRNHWGYADSDTSIATAKGWTVLT